MKNVWMAAGLIPLGFLIGCSPAVDDNEEEPEMVEEVEEVEEEEEEEYVITPSLNTSENYYRNVLEGGTYIRSDARGNTAHAMNNRVDIEQFELGLMEIAMGRFDPEDYYFQEGDNLSGEVLNSWLRRYEPSQDDEDLDEDEDEAYESVEEEHEVEESAGLNPPLADADDDEEAMREAPLILSNIIEHNYYSGDDEDVELSGVVMGISVRSVYYFRTEDEDGYYFHEQTIDEETALDYAEEAADEMLERMRAVEELENVPVTFAIFHEQPRGSVNPGTFKRTAEAGSEDTELSGWESINEQNFVFPSNAARDEHPAAAERFSEFKEDINEFFDYPAGVIGRGRYKDGNLDEMKVEINLQSHGKAEVIALTQFISSRLEEVFQSQAPVYVYLDSVEGREAVIIQNPGEEPTMHVYK